MKTHDANQPLYPAPSSSADITLKEAALRVIGNAVRYEGVKVAFARLKALTAVFGELEGWPQIVQECRKAINEMLQRMEQEHLQILYGNAVVTLNIENNFYAPVGQVIENKEDPP